MDCPRVIIKAKAQEHTSLMGLLPVKFSTNTDLFEQVGKPLATLSQSGPMKAVIHETIN
jgi:hypothetical protein